MAVERDEEPDGEDTRDGEGARDETGETLNARRMGGNPGGPEDTIEPPAGELSGVTKASEDIDR